MNITTLQIVDAIIGLVALEMFALIAYRRACGRGMPANEVLSFLGAGAGLLVALRLLLSEAPFGAFALAMLWSLAMHIWHIMQRWNGRPQH